MNTPLIFYNKWLHQSLTTVFHAEWPKANSSFAMQFRSVLALCLGAVVTGKLTQKKLKLDDNQKVYIENQPILGDGAGEGALNQCRELIDAHVQDPNAPAVRVCGTGIKATFYLRGRCEGYYEHSREVGICDTGAPPSSCAAFSPADDPNFGFYQSYMIEQC